MKIKFHYFDIKIQNVFSIFVEMQTVTDRHDSEREIGCLQTNNILVWIVLQYLA